MNVALTATRARAVLALGVLFVSGLAAARLTVWSGEDGRRTFELAFTVLGLAACAIGLLRPLLVSFRRRAWLLLGAAVTTGIVSNCLVGWDALIGLGPLRGVGLALGLVAYLLAVRALLLLVEQRMGRLPMAAWLDGITAALVLEAAIALAFLQPVEAALELRGAAAAIDFIYPVGDLLLVSLVAGAAARGGWRLEGWGTILLGIACVAFADSLQAAAVARGAYLPGGLPELGWLLGAWMLASAAWRPAPPRPEPAASRSLLPVVFALVALGLLVAGALASDRGYLPMALAGLALVGIIARLAVALGENRAMLIGAQREAVTDALTGLPNRRRLVADLERAILRANPGRPAALALYDLNGFKEYNDTFGHPAGDALLAALGSQLAGTLGPRNTAYRMGGDEFCILFTRVEGDGTEQAALAGAALEVGSEGFTVSAAHGVVLLPAEASNASDALRLADQRMYRDKANGRMASGQQVTEALTRALTVRDPRMGDHFMEVCRLAESVALKLGLGPSERERVRLAAVLHDVGKIAVPDEILDKPGPLDEQEWELMRKHTLFGQRILEAAPALRDIGPIVRSSHERIDGGGYPDGLAGHDIPVASRIIAVCDAFHAMTGLRPYREPRTQAAALEELEANAGTQFDPLVVEALRESVYELRADTVAASGDAEPANS